MANSYIQLPADGAGKKVDTESLTVASQSVHRERDQIAGAGADEIAAVKDTDPGSTLHGLVVRPLNVVNPIRDALSSADLAAGSSVDLDGTAIANGCTGKLMRVVVASSVPCKWLIVLRDGAVETTVGVCFTGGLAGRPSFAWAPPDKGFDTLAYVGGDENFRVKVTNLDHLNAANVYATIYWDEVS